MGNVVAALSFVLLLSSRVLVLRSPLHSLSIAGGSLMWRSPRLVSVPKLSRTFLPLPTPPGEEQQTHGGGRYY